MFKLKNEILKTLSLPIMFLTIFVVANSSGCELFLYETEKPDNLDKIHMEDLVPDKQHLSDYIL